MIRLRLNLFKFSLNLVGLLLPLFSFAIAGYIRFGPTFFSWSQSHLDVRAYLGLLLLTSISWALLSRQYGLTSPEKLFAAGGKSRRIASACGLTFLVISVGSSFYREAQFSHFFLVLSCILLFFLTVASQILFRVILESLRRRGKYCIRVLIIGADDFARGMAGRLMHGQLTPCQIAGYVALPNQIVSVSDSPVYEWHEIPKLAAGNGIDEALLAIPYAMFGEIPSLLRGLEPLCVPTRAFLTFGDEVEIKEQLFDFGGMPLLDLKPTPTESMSYALIKRPFDVIFSMLVLFLTFPLMILISIVIKLTSPGPVLFVQDRVGFKGQVFRMHKFRTMRGSDKEASTRWTVENDPRCTPIGSFLRRTSLDELPQFFNVLRGDMSVVGPRPERPYFVEKFVKETESYNSRHHIKAGITGWAQVNGLRGDTSIPERIQYDLYYMRNWSLGFDLQIILLTLLRGFLNKNAY
jgi:Undecaprenyl-phosphate glucose phosphotransferase